MNIRVPATTANLGPGFDSCGLALELYLDVTIEEEQSHWQVEHHLDQTIPCNEENLIVQTALKLAPNLVPHKLKVTSDIPPARGLGSSSAAIVAGIELANHLGSLSLTEAEKVMWATKMEGHPDNVAPAICGSFVVASYVDQTVTYLKHDFPECDILVYIPDKALLTSESRQALPKALAYSEAVAASSISNLLVAAIIKGDLELAGKLMAKDRWHEFYRASLVPHLAEIRELVAKSAAYGCALSGAGPTVIIFTPVTKSAEIQEQLLALPYSGQVKKLQIAQKGAHFIK